VKGLGHESGTSDSISKMEPRKHAGSCQHPPVKGEEGCRNGCERGDDDIIMDAQPRSCRLQIADRIGSQRTDEGVSTGP